MSWSLSTSIEIAAAPEVVRAKFLNFPELPIYSPEGYIRSITPQSSTDSLAVGNQIMMHIAMGQFIATIVENSPEQFAWKGGIPYVFSGVHRFRFLPSQITPGHTLFVQEEDFGGLLGFLAGKNWFGTNIGMEISARKNYDGFNADLKRGLESK